MKVTVQNIIDYLKDLHPNPAEVEVHLDKDGWMDDELECGSVRQLIHTRGLFYYRVDQDGPYLIINN